ncbi:DNA lyase, partial [Candidatus Bathyarchaeota archaeon]
MRLWSIHPSYLDWKGLGANWREALLAQAVLLGRTRGWRSHPQLNRFRAHENPVAAIGFFLLKNHEEATRRGYNYDISKIVDPVEEIEPLELTEGQLRYELTILCERLERRDP